MTLTISGVTEKDGKKQAHVKFEDGKCVAEGVIPECKIKTSSGFSDEEIGLLEEYMKDNLAMLKRKAAEINPLRAMMKD